MFLLKIFLSGCPGEKDSFTIRKNFAQTLKIDDRVETLAPKESFITLKDHKDNFQNNPTCHLINSTKSELGKVSKQILDKINKAIVDKTNVLQWKNTRATLDRFINIPNKDQQSFIAFDIVNFYPSISRKLLNDALSFAASYTDISAEDRKITFHTKQSLLFNDNTPWNKKHSTAPFDVTMGSFDGAETCELVGSYWLNQLPEGIRKQIGLYRDDGLGAFQQTSEEIEGIKKDICKVFRNSGLKITIEANKKIVNFLDVTLNLDKGSYEPYAKPNNTPLYVHRESNHPHSILKSIPLAINKRLSEIASNKESFHKAAPMYQQALEKIHLNKARHALAIASSFLLFRVPARSLHMRAP